MGQAGGGTGVIDEQLVAGTADLAHRPTELPGEAAVTIAELREIKVWRSAQPAECASHSSINVMSCGAIYDIGVNSPAERSCITALVPPAGAVPTPLR
jgi:hypothetical protein